MTLRVTIEVVPFGDESHSKIIHTLNINNVSFKEGRSALGEDTYVIEVDNCKNYSDKTPKVQHNRSDGALRLVEKALEVING